MILEMILEKELCFICRDKESKEKVFKPCKCTSSVHNSCFKTWLRLSNNNKCSICLTTIKYDNDNKIKFYYILIFIYNLLYIFIYILVLLRIIYILYLEIFLTRLLCFMFLYFYYYKYSEILLHFDESVQCRPGAIPLGKSSPIWLFPNQ